MKNTKWMKKVRYAVLAIQSFILLGCPLTVFAKDGGALGKTKLVTGTTKLIEDATKVALGLEAALCAFLIIKEFIAMQQADEQEKPRHKKNIKTTLISGIIVMCATGVLTVIFAYYS